MHDQTIWIVSKFQIIVTKDAWSKYLNCFQFTCKVAHGLPIIASCPDWFQRTWEVKSHATVGTRVISPVGWHRCEYWSRRISSARRTIWLISSQDRALLERRADPSCASSAPETWRATTTESETRANAKLTRRKRTWAKELSRKLNFQSNYITDREQSVMVNIYHIMVLVYPSCSFVTPTVVHWT